MFRQIKAFFDVSEKVQSYFPKSKSNIGIAEQFADILNDITEKKNPKIVAEKIGNILQQKFYSIHINMVDNEEEFQSLLTLIVVAIENHLQETMHVWKDRVIYFKDIKEVWIACEPMLDLIDSENGTFDMLERQLVFVEKIVYFVTDEIYFYDLKKMLEDRQKDTSKIFYVKIDQKLPHPVVIYHASKYLHGMRGKYHPSMNKVDGKYALQYPLAVDWLTYLDRKFVQSYFDSLNKHIK